MFVLLCLGHVYHLTTAVSLGGDQIMCDIQSKLPNQSIELQVFIRVRWLRNARPSLSPSAHFAHLSIDGTAQLV